MRLSNRTIVAKNGFEIVAEAENGKEAIEKYNEYKPDLVTMDISMPVMTGIEAVEEICKNDKSAKIVMVSAMGQESIVRKAIVLGAKSFIVKPYNKNRIVESLSKLIDS